MTKKRTKPEAYDFRSRFENAVLEKDVPGNKKANIPTDEEVETCINEVLIPVLADIKNVIEDHYETVEIESSKNSVKMTIKDETEIFRFRMDIDKKRKILPIETNFKFEYKYQNMLSIIEFTHIINSIEFKNLSDITTGYMSEYFEYYFWAVHEEKKAYIKNRALGEADEEKY